MKPGFVIYSISCAAVMLVAGCSSSGMPSGPVQTQPNLNALTSRASAQPSSPIDRKAIAADDMLFVGDGSSDVVRIFDFSRKDAPVGQISIDPAGACSDPAGNVWLAGNNGSGFAWYEYRHDGSGPIASLPVVTSPVSCAIDPKTGDMAVANYGYNDVATVNVYKKAQGTPKTYSVSGVTDFYFCAYDDQGNLFVQGTIYTGQYVAIAEELPSGGKSLQSISLVANRSIPGGLAWDGKHLAVAFGDSETIYRFKTGPLGATLIDSSNFAMDEHGFFYIAIHKHRLVTIAGPLDDNPRNDGFNFLAKFQYPIGAKMLNQQATGLPRGLAISLGTTSQR
jgi:hypothetical protein